ncbi:Type II/IV secretion system ATPase TadZ/CpaE, associated with Flp pilus assembly [hydrothermal vent metagenome]|uniref:Type II/IV secretion system ATPase TadZ/CpaE, associated with Flp pilus assembly n=1 Tax=hydrothermal vent metagenome TaxID=652676 RepID=A0A1W1CLA9_9ZZZZ
MIIAYVANTDKESYEELTNEFTDVQNFDTIEDFINFYAANNSRDIALIYRVNSLQDIQDLSDINFRNNMYMVVVGKDDVAFSLLAGKIGVDAYINEEEADSNIMKRLILDSQKIIKKRRGNSNISVFTGISGGMGTTTISMNLAKSIAEEYPEKNVLYLDFSYTKAISNLFFGLIQPKKSIVDISRVNSLDMDEFFENGLERLSNNLFFVPGIQKHTDKEDMEKPESILIYLNFITYIKEKFDYIIIDVGVFEDVDLKIDIQEIADDIFVITEFTIPSMSILKTYINIIDKSGWYNKTHIIANREDSFGSVTHEEARKILSKGLKHNFDIDYSIPNDATHLRECWNEAKLVVDSYPTSPFMGAIREIVNKFFIKDEKLISQAIYNKENKSFFAKVKEWL